METYYRRVLPLSPWTVLRHIDADEVWGPLSSEDLAVVSHFFSMPDEGIPVTEALMQHWVDVLIQADEDRQVRIFERINSVMTVLLETNRTEFMKEGQHPLRCILIFIRLLMRSWPDLQNEHETFGRMAPFEEMKTAFWYAGFIQISAWLDEVRQDIDEAVWRVWLPLPEEQMLRQCVILTERNLPTHIMGESA